LLTGRLVNVISYCTECPMPTLSVYTSTKAALKALSDAMRMELQKYSVDVVLFNPGDHPTQTPLCSGQERNYQVRRATSIRPNSELNPNNYFLWNIFVFTQIHH
jgi:short-subunit dehydrogenase